MLFFCGCTYLSFSDPFSYVYDAIVINVIRSGITIKNLRWYHTYPQGILCASKTMLQLDLLKIRVSCLKTLEDKNYSSWEFSYNLILEKDQKL